MGTFLSCLASVWLARRLAYNPKMMRFAIEHLPRTSAKYQVSPLDSHEARAWLAAGEVNSLVRTTELIGAIQAGLGIALKQSDTLMTLRAGDEALLISLSFSVLLAWTEGDIVPLDEDWRCLLLEVEDRSADVPATAATALDLTIDKLE